MFDASFQFVVLCLVGTAQRSCERLRCDHKDRSVGDLRDLTRSETDTGRYFCSFGTRRGDNRKTSSVVGIGSNHVVLNLC